EEKSGGLLFNIGIHYFDLLLWIFGEPTDIHLIDDDQKRKYGYIKWGENRIDWEVSIKAPMDNQKRELIVNDKRIDLTKHFEDLHTKVYEDIIQGIGIDPKEAMKSISFVEKIKLS
ncbi:MAG: hypothetical protein HYX39_13945, partial [Bacteroidetes bacterium]|nr:hypothetical protein [Bacteroidota bacterium]